MTAPMQPDREEPVNSSLNPAQKEAAEAPISPLLIVAGAGTGKTRTLTSRIAYLIESGMPPERICAITFTNKAAQEMRDRVALPSTTFASGADAKVVLGEPLIATFHSLGARILRREFRAFGRMANFVIFDDHDSFELVKKIIKEHLTKEKGAGPAFFMQKISEMKNIDGAAERWRESAERKALVQTVFEKYEMALARNNAFDFDDLIHKPVALFQKNPAVREKYQTKFDALLVDEYQDINPKQYELVRLLAEGHRNLSVVGDDEQTIYSWRYADIRTFLDFEKVWPGAKVYFLEENYRSSANIIRAAQAVAENNQYRTPKTLRTQNPEGERIALFEAWGENEEAAWIADEIQKIKTHDARAEVAILYRTNAQSRALEQALIRHDLPYQIFGGLKFYERREVKDAVAALRWAMNDRDELARERLEKNLTKRKFLAFKAKIATAQHAKQRPKPTDIITIFLETYGYFDYLEENFLNADEREENIAELISFASGFDDLPDFLEKIALLQATDDEAAGNAQAAAATATGKHAAGKAVDRKNATRDAACETAYENKKARSVNLMTIHLAKGLEFENVFIAGAAEGLLPHIRSIDNDLSLEEERRLMYVAMTRAKKKLHVSFYGMPSRFIGEIPEDCLELVDAAAMDTADANGEDGENADVSASDRGDAFEEKIIEFD